VHRFLFLLALFLAATAAASGLEPGRLNEFKVELDRELRQLAGRGQLSPVMHAIVTIAVPQNFDATRDWPVMVVCATTDPGYNSSRRLLGAYADTALASGWILIAADPGEPVEDDVALRYALDVAALAVLKLQWPGAEKAKVAFGGFSGGAKCSGWLAAAFASQGRTIMGIYLAGINEDTVSSAAQTLRVLDEKYKRIPIFLHSGDRDPIATPSDQLAVSNSLHKAGFTNVRIEYFPGAHMVDAGQLHTALEWFRELAR
jgi:predicted esterase